MVMDYSKVVRNLESAKERLEKAIEALRFAPLSDNATFNRLINDIDIARVDVLMFEERRDLLAPAQKNMEVAIKLIPAEETYEEWRYVMPRGLDDFKRQCFEGAHQISNKGHVRNTKTGVVREAPKFDDSGLLPTYNLSVTYAPDERLQQGCYLHEMLMDSFGFTKAQSIKIVNAFRRHPHSKKHPKTKKELSPKIVNLPKHLIVKSEKGGVRISRNEKTVMRKLQSEGNSTRRIAELTGRGERQVRKITLGR